MRKFLPNPLQKLLKQGLELNKVQNALPRSERITGAVSFSDSFKQLLPQVLGTPSPKTHLRFKQTTRYVRSNPSPARHLERRNRVAIAESKPKALAPKGASCASGSTRRTLYTQTRRGDLWSSASKGLRRLKAGEHSSPLPNRVIFATIVRNLHHILPRVSS